MHFILGLIIGIIVYRWLFCSNNTKTKEVKHDDTEHKD
jgi:Na+/glutamate symporter